GASSLPLFPLKIMSPDSAVKERVPPSAIAIAPPASWAVLSVNKVGPPETILRFLA
ncbi:hypothetical protein CP8484711_0610B, partial [Chlamydia psittaci 84-8471/1]